MEARLLELGGSLSPSLTLFACWRHPEADRLWAELQRRRIFVLGPLSGVVAGMPPDMLRLTARRPEVVDRMVGEIRSIL